MKRLRSITKNMERPLKLICSLRKVKIWHYLKVYKFKPNTEFESGFCPTGIAITY